MRFPFGRLILALALPAPGFAAPLVVVDIPPVQSIVAAVMEGAGEPSLLLPPGASPHGASLRPSDAARLQAAGLVIWVGPALTPWLEEPLGALAPKAVILTLEDADGMKLLTYRQQFGADIKEEHHEHADENGDDHEHHGLDPHLWLDPDNGAAIARAAAAALAALDPEDAERYAANAERVAGDLARQTTALEARLTPLRGKTFIAFHDGYQYFEQRFGLTAAGSISNGDADRPGAGHVAELRKRIQAEGIACVFAEPEFEPRLVATIVEGTAAHSGSLDGLGAALRTGPSLYPALLDALADGFAGCLAQ